MSIYKLAVLLVDPSPLPNAHPDASKIINLVLEVMGALALFMIVVAGFRYIISGNNPDAVATSKRMIIYSIVGLIVISLAAAIVNLVVGNL
jgi:hypothetical protein